MILFHSETSFKLSSKKQYKTWITELVLSKGKKVGDIHYIFCHDEHLLNINQQFLQHDNYTDIITFDYSEKETISGDIFISIERVKENAEIFQRPFKEELLRVLSHGILHLIGYNDKTEEEKKAMREEEEKAIRLFGENFSNKATFF